MKRAFLLGARVGLISALTLFAALAGLGWLVDQRERLR